MTRLRAGLRGFAILAALALFVRILVPSGFMPQLSHGQITVVACPGMVSAAVHAPKHHAPAHDGFERPCAFAAVAAAAALLALAIVLARMPAIAVRRAPPLRAPPATIDTLRWRPPLRAPPLILSVR